MCLTNAGKLVVWGKSQDGRLGVSSADSFVPPTVLKDKNLPTEIIDFACGDWHCLALSNTFEIYAWGKNTAGQLGFQNTASIFPVTKLSFPSPVANVFCGPNYSMVITKDTNILYSWGNNSFCQLGIATPKPWTYEPQRVEIPFPVVKVSCGVSHVGAITTDNRLFMWGSNSRGELGLGTKCAMKNLPSQVAFFQMDVIDISCSFSKPHPHSLAITEDANGAKQAWSWGDNYKEKLGLGDQTTEQCHSHPQLIVTLNGKNIQKVCAGGIHSVALCDGQVYTWGCGSDGRLGHPEYIGSRYLYKESTPRVIGQFGEGQVIDVASNYYHCACIVLP